jgi:diacylglycerol kinase (ATP)
MRVGVVFNPTSNEEDLDAVRRGLGALPHDFIWEETTEKDPGVGQAQKLAEQGVELVVVAGGDGTARACAEGLAGTGVALGVVPLGTGNLLARNLGIPLDVEDSIEVVFGGDRETLDAGVINGEVFTVIAGTGFDAAIMEATDSDLKERIGSLAYVLEGVRHLADAPIRAEVQVDGVGVASGKWATVLIGNLGRLQGGVDLFPDAARRDGRLQMLALSAETTLEALAAGFAAVTHNDDSRHVFRATGESFRIDLDSPAPYQMDGEARPVTDSLTVETAPSLLEVVVPGSSR